MKPTITKEKLEEIRKRAEAATEGPWKFCGNKWGDLAVYSPSIRAGMNNGGEIAELEGALLTDADFIANARQDIPALLDHIAELEAELKAACCTPLKADRKEQLRRFIGSSSIGSISLTDVLREYKYEGSDEDDNV
ncbi:hypothetical protein U7118_07460 [Bacillus subtilis]|uniref:hypothetical protein n=1 Tax=Bacillus subtilis TaxID=1423 RepID=UPI002B4BFCE4|nr:hypothetical protein [Bacillus subtilis]WRK89065.1 hypothetical protein U7118_07460 [Bacillus subtilis]